VKILTGGLEERNPLLHRFSIQSLRRGGKRTSPALFRRKGKRQKRERGGGSKKKKEGREEKSI